MNINSQKTTKVSKQWWIMPCIMSDLYKKKMSVNP